MNSYRHELKFYISRADYELISRRLSLTMSPDENAGPDGKYFIRSLYFDDYADSALMEKLNGNPGRDKLRIRIYNMQDSVIKLECKHKEGSFILKSAISLSRAECEALIAGQYAVLLRRHEPLAKRFYAMLRLGNCKPRVIVDYHREAYVYSLEDVRVTFDHDVHTAYRSTALFDPDAITYPVIDDYAMVMEVKFNNYLPSYIRSLIQPVQNAQRSAISKYVLCRRYE